MGIAAAGLLTVALFFFIFWPQRSLTPEVQKTRLDYLEERKAAIYDNLRDLNFDYAAGKHPEADYAVQRQILEDEAEGVILEMETLQSASRRL